jgi:predicted phosphate transport protein (TIGR00153 family)
MLVHERNRSYRVWGRVYRLTFNPNTDYSTSERKAFDIISDQMREVVLTVKELRILIEAWAMGNTPEMEESYKKLNQLETSADEIRISLLSEVSKAGPGLLLKEDILRFLVIDKIVDTAVGSAFYVSILKDWQIPSELSEKILVLADISIAVVTHLKSAIFNVLSNPENALNFAREIDILEKQVDKLYRPLIVKITELNDDLKIIMALRELVLRVDEIADIGLEMADAVRMLALTR